MNEVLDLVATAIEALNKGEWQRAADLVDPAELERWFSDQVQIDDTPPPEITPEELKRHDPDMPDEVAEYQIARIRKNRELYGSSPYGQFAGVQSRSELAKLPPAEALARYLQAQDPNWQFAERLKNVDPQIAPHLRPETLRRWREPVGAVAEGQDKAHVVYRVRWEVAGEGDPEGEMRVATLRRTPDGWRLLLRGELFEYGGTVVSTEAPEAEE